MLRKREIIFLSLVPTLFLYGGYNYINAHLLEITIFQLANYYTYIVGYTQKISRLIGIYTYQLFSY